MPKHPCSCEPSPNRGAKAEISWFCCFLLFFLSQAVGHGHEPQMEVFCHLIPQGNSILGFCQSCQGPQKFSLECQIWSNLVKCHLSGCQNPDDLCYILSSLSPFLLRTFRGVGFFFRGLSRAFSRFYQRGMPPIASSSCSSSSSIPPSAASSRSEWALPELNRERHDFSGHCHSLTTFLGVPIPASQDFRRSFAKLSRIFGSHL